MISPQPDEENNRDVKTILILAANPAETSRLQLDNTVLSQFYGESCAFLRDWHPSRKIKQFLALKLSAISLVDCYHRCDHVGIPKSASFRFGWTRTRIKCNQPAIIRFSQDYLQIDSMLYQDRVVSIDRNS
ncbi:MAG: hypothetical protein PUP92_23190 [Rhizonema sp. PD38]|nr:hypothetical protein [Rhizonema sp. PD38]